MTLQEKDPTIAQVMEALISNGMDSMGEAFAILYNAAMEIERAQFLGAGRYERCENRIGQANGFKDKIIISRAGRIPLNIPQVRDLQKDTEGFYPKALERGIRSECLNKEIKRRTKAATLFPNEESLLRLVSAVLAEISEDWETGKVYLSMENA